jgi:hypothetical protein
VGQVLVQRLVPAKQVGLLQKCTEEKLAQHNY